jgi:signal transducing adaptor molecule
MDACDKVNDDPEDGAKNAISAVTKRLNIDNANVQIYSLIVS